MDYNKLPPDIQELLCTTRDSPTVREALDDALERSASVDGFREQVRIQTNRIIQQVEKVQKAFSKGGAAPDANGRTPLAIITIEGGLLQQIAATDVLRIRVIDLDIDDYAEPAKDRYYDCEPDTIIAETDVEGYTELVLNGME